MGTDYYQTYFEYAGAGVSEPPNIFHRWGATSIIGTLLGRQLYLPFGHGQIYPNQYVTLMGAPGARKSTAINIASKLLKATGFTRFAADRVSKERFLMDMQKVDAGLEAEDLALLTLNEPAECFIVAEEFTDFVGANNMEFITMLTKLWDNPPEYTQPKIHGASVSVNEPTVNILAGNTSQGFALAFPPEALGNGFLSRMIFVHGEPTGRKVTFPARADPLMREFLVCYLKEIKKKIVGEASFTDCAIKLSDKLYTEFKEIDDSRFKHYSTRRLTHLFKIALILAACDLRTSVGEIDLLKANTMLHFTEVNMPKALGEFGKSKFSDVSNSILDVLNQATKPVSMQDLWKHVSKDLSKITELAEVVKNLQHAGKIQTMTVGTKTGLMPLKTQASKWASDLIVPEWLTEEERSM